MFYKASATGAMKGAFKTLTGLNVPFMATQPETSRKYWEPPTGPQDSCAGSPHPNPGGLPDAILSATGDKTAGHGRLWTTLPSEGDSRAIRDHASRRIRRDKTEDTISQNSAASP